MRYIIINCMETCFPFLMGTHSNRITMMRLPSLFIPICRLKPSVYSSAGGGSTQRPLSLISWINASVAYSISIPRFTTVWDHQCHPSFNIKNKPRTTFLTLIYYHACQPTAFSNWAWFLYLSESMLLMIHHGKYKMAEWWLFKPWRVGEIYAEQHQYHATETFLVVNKNKMFATTLKLPSMAYQTQKANRL